MMEENNSPYIDDTEEKCEDIEETSTSTPQETTQTSSWWNWGEQLLNKVSTQATEIAGTYAKDLEEFSNSVATETNEVFQKVTQKAQSITTSIVKASEDPDLSQKFTSTIQRGVDTFKSGIDTLVKEVNNVTDKAVNEWNKSFEDDVLGEGGLSDEALGDIDEFNQYLLNFNVEDKSEEIVKLLENTSVRDLYQQLVPKELSSQEFWGRFFYKHEMAEEKERKRLNFVKSMQESIETDDLEWDDDKEEEKKDNEEIVVEEVKKIDDSEAPQEEKIEPDNEVKAIPEEHTESEPVEGSAEEPENVEPVEKTKVEEPLLDEPVVDEPKVIEKELNPTVKTKSLNVKEEDEDVFEWE